MDEETPTDWVVWCPAHRHYLKFAGSTGTTWTDNQNEARRYSKSDAVKAAHAATWRDHNPTPWAIARKDA